VSVYRLTDLLERRGEERGISQLVLVGEEWNSRLQQFVRVHLSAPSHPQASQPQGLQIRIRTNPYLVDPDYIRNSDLDSCTVLKLHSNFKKVPLQIINVFLIF
jgi:hypothetical protein